MRRFIFLIFSLISVHLPAQQTVGVFKNTPESFHGYTLFSNNGISYLINNCGELVKSWESDYRPGLSTYLLDNGQLLRTGVLPGLFSAGGRGGLVELFSWEGQRLWSAPFANDTIHAHHDVEPLPNGNILVLVWDLKSEAETLAAGLKQVEEIWSERILEIEMRGNDQAVVVWEWDLWDHLIQDQDSSLANFGLPSAHPERVDINFKGTPDGNSSDWIHANAISYNAELDQIAISSRHLNEIWVIDHSTTTTEAASSTGGKYGKGGDLLYRFGNPQSYGRGTPEDQLFSGQHDVQWLPQDGPDKGKMMVFDNNIRTGPSTIEIWSPPIDEQGFYSLEDNQPFGPAMVDWSYTGDDFYSPIMSSAQQLPNGNILACLSDEGRVVELTPSGAQVWEYINPVNWNSGPVSQGDVARFNQIFRAKRYAPDHPALVGRNLIAGNTVEFNPQSTDCILYDSLVSSIPLISDDELYILANPFVEELSIVNHLVNSVTTLEIYDLMGRLIHQQIVEPGQQAIQLGQEAEGLYLLKFSDQRGRRLIKKVYKSGRL